MTDDNLIQPRTKKERAAYIQGFAEAISMSEKEGKQAAIAWLREMAELDGLIPRDNAQN
jgi:hypothetical protein